MDQIRPTKIYKKQTSGLDNAEIKRALIATLSRVKQSVLGACAKTDAEKTAEVWNLISIAVDSGAFTNVIDPADLPS